MITFDQIPRYLLIRNTPVAIERDGHGKIAVFVWNSATRALERGDESILEVLDLVDSEIVSWLSTGSEVWEITREIYESTIAGLFAKGA